MFHIKGNNIGTFDNHAGYAICIVTGITFLFYFQRNSQRYIRYITLLAIFLLFISLLISNSRNGLITITIITGIYCLYSKKTYVRKSLIRHIIVVLGIVVMFACFLFVLFLFREESVWGRMLIWETSMSMISDRPLLGYGLSGFEKYYMDYQAALFSDNPDKFGILLADNVKHPFNEYLYLICTFGLVGLIVLILISYGIYILYKHNKCDETFIVALSLLSVAIYSFASYPFRYPFTWILCVCCLYILAKPKLNQIPILKRQICSILGLCILCICSYFYYNRIITEVKWVKLTNWQYRINVPKS